MLQKQNNVIAAGKQDELLRTQKEPNTDRKIGKCNCPLGTTS